MANKKRNIRILFIARRFPPAVGGMEKFAYDLSNNLKLQGVDVVQITWGKSNLWLPIIIPMFIAKGLWELLTDRKITVIHIQDALLSPVGWLLHILSAKPFIVIAHGLDLMYDQKIYQKLIPFFVKRATGVISISSATNKQALARGVDKKKARIIPLGATDFLSSFKTGSARPAIPQLKNKTVILTVGRLVRRKGVHWFIKNVLPDLLSQYPELVYVVAGSGPDYGRVDTLVKNKQLEKKALLLGEISEELKYQLYQTSDIFVMPNVPIKGDMEGFGIVAHEAALARLPIVASNLEGIADALQNGENAILVRPLDKQGYLKAISKLLKNSQMRKKLGNKAKAYTLKTFGWENVVRQYVDVYQKAAGEK